jgi:hypothetical protein
MRRQLEYPVCECTDPYTGEYLNHIPCQLISLVIARMIYTAEEADRREEEEEEMMEEMDKVVNKIKDYMTTPVSPPRTEGFEGCGAQAVWDVATAQDGKLKLKEEVTYRRERVQGAILSREAKVAQFKEDLRVARSNLASLRSVQYPRWTPVVLMADDMVCSTCDSKRETAFNQGLPFEYHRIEGRQAIDVLLDEAEMVIETVDTQIKTIREEVKGIEEERHMTDKQLAHKAVQDMIQKCIYFESEKVGDEAFPGDDHHQGAGPLLWMTAGLHEETYGLPKPLAAAMGRARRP